MITGATESCGKIDVHTHYLPDFYVRALVRAGLDLLDGFPRPQWSVATHLEAMARHGIAASILSVSTPCVHFVHGREAQALARQINEEGASLKQSYPRQLGAFATLPLDEPARAVEEAIYALDTLGLDGVIMETNVNGVYIGSDALDSLYAELDQRNACILVHPTSPACGDALSLGRPTPMIEFGFDTTRAIVDLILSGKLARFPNLRIIVPHAGASLPILAPRLAMFAQMPFLRTAPSGADSLLADLRRLHYDLAATAHPTTFGALRELVPSSQILFATDWPFTPDSAVQKNVEGFDALPMSTEDREAIAFRNALRLFPRLAERLALS